MLWRSPEQPVSLWTRRTLRVASAYAASAGTGRWSSSIVCWRSSPELVVRAALSLSSSSQALRWIRSPEARSTLRLLGATRNCGPAAESELNEAGGDLAVLRPPCLAVSHEVGA